MFSFVGDTVLDPFTGTASTQVAAAACGRNTLGVEVDPVYFEQGLTRLRQGAQSSPNHVVVEPITGHHEPREVLYRSSGTMNGVTPKRRMACTKSSIGTPLDR